MGGIYYKYMSCADTKHKDYVLDSLKQKYFYFSRPSELRTVNDNSECVVENDYTVNSVDEIIEWYIRKGYSFSSELYKHAFKMFKTIKEKGKPEYLEIKARADEEHFHIFSLTDDFENYHMWENFAGKSNGICIGYKSAFSLDTPFIEVVDKGNLPIHSGFLEVREGKPVMPVCDVQQYGNFYVPKPLSDKNGLITGRTFFGLLKVTYVDVSKRQPYNIFHSEDKENRQRIAKYILEKDLTYEKEQEYRGLVIDCISAGKIDFIPQSLKPHYPDNVLAEIIFGYACPNSVRTEIIEILKCNYSNFKNISFFETELSSENKIVPHPINADTLIVKAWI